MNWLNQYFNKMVGGSAVPQAPKVSSVLLCGLGASLAIAPVATLTDFAGVPFLMAPFGASCFLAFAAADSPLAQPRNIIFGHLISAAVGLIVLNLLGSNWWTMALAVGLAIILMQVTRTGHAPAGADPLVVLLIQPDWSFLIFPVLSGAVIIALVAVLFNNLRRGVTYPKYW